jgi:diaminohydroxyphosphoribosylaminopyrimidine deaminase/5-amino-6-(5-phosphoribosylamino)uracil reductase
LRHLYDAILIGAGTAVADDPLLTDRSGKKRRRPLVRVVLDENLRLSPESQLAQSAREFPTLVFASERADTATASTLSELGVEVLKVTDGGRDLHSVLHELSNRSIQSVLVEGGAHVAGAFLDAGLIDKASFFIAPLIIGGREAPVSILGNGAEKITDAIRLQATEIFQHGRDIEVTGYISKVMRSEG